MRFPTIIAALLLSGTLAFGAPQAKADQLAGKLLAEGRVDDAIVTLQNNIHSGSAQAESYNLLCQAYFTVQQWDAGISACQKAVQLEPNNAMYHLWLGRLYGGKADHSSFITAAGLAGNVRNEFETAVKLDPRSVEARADLADFYLEAPGIVGGGKDKAAAQAQEMEKIEPGQGHMVLAKIDLKNKNYVAAENEYRQAIQLTGGKAGPWLGLARVYQRTGRLQQMQDAVLHATDPKLNRPDVLPTAAQLLISAGRDFDGAEQMLRRYLSSQATVADAPVFQAHYLLGTLFEKRGDKQGAAEQYQAALALAKNYSPAQNALNRVRREMRKQANAGQ